MSVEGGVIMAVELYFNSCISIVSVSISWLRYFTVVLQDVITGETGFPLQGISLYDFLQWHVNLKKFLIKEKLSL